MPKFRVILIYLLIAAALFAGLVWMHLSFTEMSTGGSRFLVQWSGARQFVTEGINPYTEEAVSATQQLIYGHPAREGEYPYHLDAPFFILLFILPFGAIKDFSLAYAVWWSALDIAWLAIAFLSLALVYGEKMPRFVMVLFSVFVVVGWYSNASIADGSVAPMLAALFLGALLALRNEQDELAGILLALTLYKWEVSGLFLLLLLLWLASHRRWRAPRAMLMSFIVLLVISLIVLPEWMLPFLRASLANFRAEHGITLSLALQTFFPENGERIAMIVRILLSILLFVEWHAVRGGDFRRLLWTVSLTFVLTPLIGLPASLGDYAPLALPLALVITVTIQRWRRFGAWIWGILLVMLTGSFFLSIFEQFAPMMDAFFFLLLPVLLLVSLYWLRWWILRPPRTWADQVAEISS